MRRVNRRGKIARNIVVFGVKSLHERRPEGRWAKADSVAALGYPFVTAGFVVPPKAKDAVRTATVHDEAQRQFSLSSSERRVPRVGNRQHRSLVREDDADPAAYESALRKAVFLIGFSYRLPQTLQRRHRPPLPHTRQPFAHALRPFPHTRHHWGFMSSDSISLSPGRDSRPGPPAPVRSNSSLARSEPRASEKPTAAVATTIEDHLPRLVKKDLLLTAVSWVSSFSALFFFHRPFRTSTSRPGSRGGRYSKVRGTQRAPPVQAEIHARNQPPTSEQAVPTAQNPLMAPKQGFEPAIPDYIQNLTKRGPPCQQYLRGMS